MRISKAVITAAGRGIRLFPAADTVQKAMLPIADRDGLVKPLLQIIAEEALDSGIEEICVVAAPGDEAKYRTQFGLLRDNLLETFRSADWARTEAERIDSLMNRLHFRVQEEPRGYGDSVRQARDFVREEPFLLLLSDHLYVSHDPARRCARQLLDLAEAEGCPVASVNPTREHLVRNYGTATGKRLAGREGVYRLERIVEKPSVSQAELELVTPGLRAGYYLCFFGMHVLPPSLFGILDEMAEPTGKSQHSSSPPSRSGELQLSPALQELARRDKFLALEVKGSRYDIGAKYGALRAQLALGLSGRERDQVLSSLAELLAESQLRQGD